MVELDKLTDSSHSGLAARVTTKRDGNTITQIIDDAIRITYVPTRQIFWEEQLNSSEKLILQSTVATITSAVASGILLIGGDYMEGGAILACITLLMLYTVYLFDRRADAAYCKIEAEAQVETPGTQIARLRSKYTKQLQAADRNGNKLPYKNKRFLTDINAYFERISKGENGLPTLRTSKPVRRSTSVIGQPPSPKISRAVRSLKSSPERRPLESSRSLISLRSGSQLEQIEAPSLKTTQLIETDSLPASGQFILGIGFEELCKALEQVDLGSTISAGSEDQLVTSFDVSGADWV
jgi:hypothetical protein